MGKRVPDYRRVKTHRSYTVEEAARLFGCHRNTIRNWQRHGLQAIDGLRPAVFDGATLAAFLQSRRAKRKQPLKHGQIFCLPCRSPKEPAGSIAEYIALTETTGNLRGICPSCDRLIHRAVSCATIEAVRGKLEVIFAEASTRIREIELATNDPTTAERLLRDACEKLLANRIVENFQVEVL